MSFMLRICDRSREPSEPARQLIGLPILCICAPYPALSRLGSVRSRVNGLPLLFIAFVHFTAYTRYHDER